MIKILHVDELPPSILERAMDKEAYYKPEEFRKLILETFPQKDWEWFDGLGHIVPRHNYSFLDDWSWLTVMQKHPREYIINEAFPEWRGRDRQYEITEDQMYHTDQMGEYERRQLRTTVDQVLKGYKFNRTGPYFRED